MAHDHEKKPHSYTALLSRLFHLMGDPKFRILVGLGSLALIAVLVTGYQMGVTPADFKRWMDITLAFLQARPLILFLAVCILPALPIPASPLLILCGVVYTPLFGTPTACLLAVLAMGINMTWTYLLAAYPAHAFVQRLLKKYDFQIPALAAGSAVQLILILRLTPGFPFFVQNLLLGFLKAPFRVYLPLSLAITGAFSVGFVVSGGAIFQGKGLIALGGIALIVAAVSITALLRKRLTKPGTP